MGLCPVSAQQAEGTDTSAVVTNAFGDNWNVQFGIDMTLLNPYGHDFKDVFPNGKAFGIDVALGKWFSPEFGLRGKVKWGNGILKNDHALWFRPYGEPGGNHRKGGFVTFVGDVELNLHNLFGTYQPDRMWNAIVAPRAGGYIDVGSGKGAPVLGVGFINTFRLDKRWSLVAEAGYQFISSVNDISSGTESGSNGYVEVGVGVQMDLGKNTFHKASEQTDHYRHAVAIKPFWSDWFLQAGLGMSLQNPCGTNFAHVFPNGKTLGINAAVGKWFTPEVGVRGGINWQNGLIGNNHLSYMDLEGQPGSNHDKGGFIAIYADVFLNLHHIIGCYNNRRTWNAIFFPRMGIAENFSSSFNENPIVGLGTEQTFRLNNRMKIFADLVYQVATSGFLDDRFYSGYTGANSNGWFDLNVGVSFALGKIAQNN